MRWVRGLVVAACLATMAVAPDHVAASSDPPGAGGFGGDCAEPSGELTVGTLIEMQGFDNTSGGSVGIAGGNERLAFYDVLMTYDNDTNEFVPRVAESLTPNEDYTAWTLTLRDGITFGNGNPLTTAAVEASVNRHKADDTTSAYKAQAVLVESMEIVDDLTMVFHLTDPWGNFPWLLAGAPGMVADPAVFDELGPEAFALDPTGAGAGPYELERYVPGEELVLTAKDNWWGGPVCLQTLRFVNVASEEGRRDAFLNGELGAAVFQTSATFADLREAGFEPHTFVAYGNETVLINHGTGGVERPGSDVRVRQAIAHALDVDVIDQRMTGGVGIPSSALADEDSPLYTPGLEGPQYDLELATQLLAEAMADGYDGNITLKCHNTPQLVEWAIAVQALLEAVGFNVELDNARSLVDHVTGVYYTGDYDIACLAISLTVDAPWETLSTFIVPSSVQQTRVGYTSDAMVTAMNDLRAAATLEDRAAALAVVQDIWNEDIPVAITNHAERGMVWQDAVAGLEFTNNANAFFAGAQVDG